MTTPTVFLIDHDSSLALVKPHHKLHRSNLRQTLPSMYFSEHSLLNFDHAIPTRFPNLTLAQLTTLFEVCCDMHNDLVRRGAVSGPETTDSGRTEYKRRLLRVVASRAGYTPAQQVFTITLRTNPLSDVSLRVGDVQPRLSTRIAQSMEWVKAELSAIYADFRHQRVLEVTSRTAALNPLGMVYEGSPLTPTSTLLMNWTTREARGTEPLHLQMSKDTLSEAITHLRLDQFGSLMFRRVNWVATLVKAIGGHSPEPINYTQMVTTLFYPGPMAERHSTWWAKPNDRELKFLIRLAYLLDTGQLRLSDIVSPFYREPINLQPGHPEEFPLYYNAQAEAQIHLSALSTVRRLEAVLAEGGRVFPYGKAEISAINRRYTEALRRSVRINTIAGQRRWPTVQLDFIAQREIILCECCEEPILNRRAGDNDPAWLTCDGVSHDTVGGGVACEVCAHNEYKYSEWEDKYVPEREAVPLYTNGNLPWHHGGCSPDDWVSQDAVDTDGNLWESEGHSLPYNSLYNEFAMDESSWDNYQDYVHSAENSWDDEDDEDEAIGEYHSSKNLVGYINDPTRGENDPTLGLELETEVDEDRYCRHSTAQEWKSVAAYYQAPQELLPKGRATYRERYMGIEGDGSLDYGFEMVTGWTGLRVHEHQLKLLLSESSARSGCTSHDTSTCGLHIHMGSQNMTMLHHIKLSIFMSEPDNQAAIKRIARRGTTDYTHQPSRSKRQAKQLLDEYASGAIGYVPESLEGHAAYNLVAQFLRAHGGRASERTKENRKSPLSKEVTPFQKWVKGFYSPQAIMERMQHGRYRALNYQNGNTIEFRLFRGTLKYETIMASLEFVHNLYHFARDAGLTELTMRHFVEFIHDPKRARDTRYLKAYLYERNVEEARIYHAKNNLDEKGRRRKVVKAA